MKLRTIPIVLAGLSVLASPAHALVTYDSDAFSTFTVVDLGGMTATLETGPEVPSTSTTGTGTVSVDADVQTPFGIFMLGVGESVTQESEVSGSADAPSGASMATVMNGVLVTLTNPGMGAATAVFEFSYEWFAEVIRSDTFSEAGSASPFFHLTGFAPSGGETLAIDEMMGGGPMAVTDWLVNPAVGFALKDPTPSMMEMGTATVLALVTVPAMSIESFSVITDSSGSALHVPEPGTGALMLMSLVGVGMARRRGRR